MKILKVGYGEECAMFAVEGFPKVTFTIPLKGKKDKEDVLDELRVAIAAMKTDEAKAFFEDVGIKTLEGKEV